MARGDVVWIDLGNPVGGSGHEQSGDRPAVILSTDDNSSSNPMVIVVPLTKVLTARRFSHTFEITPSAANGLSRISVALVFQISAYDKRRIRRTAGCLEPHYLAQIESTLSSLLGI